MWSVLALVALGVWGSLLPQITYPSSSSGEAAGDALIAWSGWSIQQDLGPLSGAVGSFRIWVSADPTAFHDVELDASLIDAANREVLRQTTISVSRIYFPTEHTVTFPNYVVSPAQRLMLQLGVPESEGRYVIYRLAHSDPGQPNVMLNGVPDAKMNGVPDSSTGPLAFAHMRTGSGLRAAIDGHAASRLHLALALGLGTLAVLAYPRVAGKVGRLAGATWHLVQRRSVRVGRAVRIAAGIMAEGPPAGGHRLLATPWYPWPVAAAPILHYTASNPFHFDVIESVIPLSAALIVVAVLMFSLRVGLKNWHRAAAVCTVVLVMFFAYGHVADAISDRIDDRMAFGLALVIAVAIPWLIIRRGAVDRLTPFLNLTAAILLVFPSATLVSEAVAEQRQAPMHGLEDVEELAAHLLPAGLPEVSGPRPDIYYIILDSYSRHDLLLNQHGYDNSEFLDELERRGFYVAREASSNYITTIHSVPSILNLAYLDELGTRTPTSRDDLEDLAHRSALAAILKELGYTYIHLESGYKVTDASPLADRVISFTPSGMVVRSGTEIQSHFYADGSGPLLSTRFVRGLAHTTALSPVVGDNLIRVDSDPYHWKSAERVLRMFEFLSGEIDAEAPKFVFAHIVKLHGPTTFDQYGNYLTGGMRFHDEDDPSVPSAFVGQLKYVNKRVLEMVDGILRRSRSEPAVIVITGDHAYQTASEFKHPVLSAFHLPDADADLYESISLVNHFRYILDSYFGLDLGMLEDRILWHSKGKHNFLNP